MKWPEKLVAGAVALVALVAILQYRSIDQASRAERARMSAELQASLARFAQEFDGEINRAFVAANSTGAPEREIDESAVRIAGWRAATPYRNLARDFFRYSDHRLYRFDAASEGFQPAEWPAAISSLAATLNAWTPQQGPPVQVLAVGDQVVITGRHLRPGEFRPGMPPPEAFGGWSIIHLDLNYIQHEMLPQLDRKHLPAEYELRVVARGDPGHVLYATTSRTQSTPPDASASLFELRSDAGGGPGRGRGRGRRGGGGQPGGPFARQQALPGEEPPGRGGMWEVQARHVAGSIAAGAQKARNRDLAVSAIVLLLLLATVGALVLVTRRAQRLATLQMEFVSGVSHELRTPLAVIGSAADNLAGGVVTTDAQVRRYGALIRSEGRRLTQMIEQVLSYSSLQSGRKRMDRRPIEIGGVIDRAIAACAGQVEESRCTIEKEIPAGLPRVAADEASLIHCIANLLGNALKYGEPGHWVRVDAAAHQDSVEIRVSDNGFGIDPADLPHIFDAFYRGHSVAGGTIRGTGLGLNLVRRIVQAHHGTVGVESTPGKGSCFTVVLPAANTENPA